MSNVNLEEARSEFFTRFKDQISNNVYHEADLARLKNGTAWMAAFAKHGFDDFNKTVNLIDEVLKWRKEFGANDLLTPNKYPFPEELFTRGALYRKNYDKQSHPLIHFAVKTHKKGQYPFSQVSKFITYFFEKEYKFNVTEPIVLILDMYDAGYSNMDMELIQFIVQCLKTYYPGLIDYLIIFQMPFVFNAVWKVIKAILPPQTVKLVKFCDKKSIREYVDEDQLLLHMGGTDKFKYNYVSGMFDRNEKEPNAIKNNSPSTNDDLNKDLSHVSLNKKRDEATLPTVESLSSISVGTVNVNGVENGDDSINSGLVLSANNSTSSPLLVTKMNDTKTSKRSDLSKSATLGTLNATAKSMTSSSTNYDLNKATELTFGDVVSTPLLSISPGDELIFSVKEAKQDITQSIKLTNTSGMPLAYKIKITSPDKFRVKPGMGIIQTSACVQIMINFLKDYHNATPMHRDKFLILWTPISETTLPSEINEFWKQAIQRKVNINEHKVKCIVTRPNEFRKTSTSAAFNKGNNNTETLRNDEINKSLYQSIHVPGNSSLLDSSAIHHQHQQQQSSNEINSSVTLLNSKLTNLELNTNMVIENQQKLNRQYSNQMYLIIFLILLNMIQLLFQSNLFTQIIEPYIDRVLFSD